MGLSPLAPLTSLGTAVASGAASSAASTVGNFLTGKTAQIVVIVIGLLFIAAGIFSLRKTQDIIVTAAKGAAAAA